MMKVNESQLDTLIKYYLVREYVEQGISRMCIKEFLPLMIALLYPYKDADILLDSKSSGKIKSIVNTIRAYTKKTEGLEKYSLEGLRRYFQYKWLPTIDFNSQISLIKVISLIDIIEDNGFFSIKGNEKVYDSYLHRISIPDISKHYGCEAFEILEENQVIIEYKETGYIYGYENKKGPQQNIINTNNNIKDIESVSLSQQEKDFLNMWESEKLPTKLRKGKFFWQFKISGDQYTKIKKGLISLHFGDKNAKFIRKYAFYISAFLAEWFKREYDGYQNERGLSIIGIDTQQSRRIWEDSKFPDSYLINSGQNEYLFSIYVLGGFPIRYILRVRRFDALLKNIWELKQGEDIDEEILDGISDSFDSNNTVYQGSLLKGGSLYSYIEDLLNDKCPISQDDSRLEPYKTYCELLEEGKKHCFENFFSCQWNIYTDGIAGVDAFANVKIGPKKNKCYIPFDCIKLWKKVPDVSSVQEFQLGLETDTRTKSEIAIRFSKSGQSFVGWGDTTTLSLMLDVQQINHVKVMFYYVDDVNRENGIQVQEAFEFPNFCQLYQTSNPYKWSNEKDIKAHSAIFFNSLKYSITDGKEDAKYLVDADKDKPSWMWVRVYDLVTLVDNSTDEEHSFNSKQGAMSVFFNKEKGVRYNQYDEVSHVYYDEDDTPIIESVTLLLSTKGIKRVKLFPFEENEKAQNITDYKVFYKQNNRCYEPFKENSTPDCGMLQLKIIYKEYKPIIKKCYFLPQKELLVRKVETKAIRFTSPGVSLWKPIDEEDFERVSTPISFDCSDYKKSDDVIPFHIGEEKDYIVLDVYRADNCREIYFKDRCLSTRKEKSIDIPVILKNNFYIRTIDENGVKRTEPGRHIMIANDFITQQGSFQNTAIEDKEEGIRYYLYINKSVPEIGRNALKISKKQKDNYQFYYWSFEPDEAPIKLECTFDESTQCLMVPLGNLENKGYKHGIIFQSLKDVTPPNYVYPFYPKNVPWLLLANTVFNDEVMMASLRVAAEHGIYFSQFYPLRKLFDRYDFGKDLVKFVMTYLRKYNQKQDFIAMHRFAYEFSFDWFLLPWKFWVLNCKSIEDKVLAERLFRLNPFMISPIEKTSLDLILDKYWDLTPSRNWSFSRNKKDENMALQSMRCSDKDFCFLAQRSKSGIITYDIDRNIELLTAIHNSDRFYKDLQREIFEKIIKKQS